MSIEVGQRVSILAPAPFTSLSPGMVDKRPRALLVESIVGRAGVVKVIDTGTDGMAEPVYGVDIAGDRHWLRSGELEALVTPTTG